MGLGCYSKPLYDHKLRQAEKSTNFSFDGKTYLAKVVDIYDGDTITVVFRRRGKLEQHKIRFFNLDTAELKPLKTAINREKEIKAANVSKDALINQIAKCNYLVKIECFGFDKYGRILANVYTRSGWFTSSINLNQWMIENKYGIPYDGGTKQAFSTIS